MTMTRRTLLAGATAGALAPLGSAFGQSAEFSYKYANNLPLTHPLNARAKEMADAIKAETKGRVEIQIFPNNQLGSDTDMLSQVRSGGIEFFTLSGLILSTLVPVASINGMGFAFPNYDTVWRAMDGDLGTYVRAQIAKANLVAMDKIWDNGFREITSSSKPIASPADLKDFKIRVPVSPLWTSMFKAFGSAPTSITSARSTPRCRPRWWMARRTRSPSSRPPSSTRCRSSARSPTTCGTASGSSPTSAPGNSCRPTCAPSSPSTSTPPH
jgi:TRAP-type C4-dicarboxylate transport system substrate-binding protein